MAVNSGEIMSKLKVYVFYCDRNVYPFGKASFEWICSIYIIVNGDYVNGFFSSVTKPTARQLRRWKKQVKQSNGC
jgi:hypothetical protein